MSTTEMGGFLFALGVCLPFFTDSYLIWFHEREINALAEYDKCKKAGTKFTAQMKDANFYRWINRLSLCLICTGLVLVVLGM